MIGNILLRIEVIIGHWLSLRYVAFVTSFDFERLAERIVPACKVRCMCSGRNNGSQLRR